MVTDRITREIAGWAGVAGVITVTVTIPVSVLLFDGYDWERHYLSSLGALTLEGAELSFFVYNPGLVITASFGLVFSVGLYRLFDRRLWRAGAVVYAISHLTVVWQAVFPVGTEQHEWISIFPFFIVSLLLIGFDQVRFPETRVLGLLVVSNLLVPFVGGGLVLQLGLEGGAIPQTIGVTVFTVVSLVYAAVLLGKLPVDPGSSG